MPVIEIPPNDDYPLNYEEYIPINDYFTVWYTGYKNEKNHYHVNDYWFSPQHKNWKKFPFVEPITIPLIKNPHEEGTKFACCEHASVCIRGFSRYTMKSPTGNSYVDWGYGTHNTENGFGYLLEEEFETFYTDDFMSCCAAQNPGVERENVYKFEVIQETFTTNKNYEWIHIANQSLVYDDVTYNQKETLYNVPVGKELTFANQCIIIACYL